MAITTLYILASFSSEISDLLFWKLLMWLWSERILQNSQSSQTRHVDYKVVGLYVLCYHCVQWQIDYVSAHAYFRQLLCFVPWHQSVGQIHDPDVLLERRKRHTLSWAYLCFHLDMTPILLNSGLYLFRAQNISVFMLDPYQQYTKKCNPQWLWNWPIEITNDLVCLSSSAVTVHVIPKLEILYIFF